MKVFTTQQKLFIGIILAVIGVVLVFEPESVVGFRNQITGIGGLIAIGIGLYLVATYGG